MSFFKSLFFIGALAIASSCGNNDDPVPVTPPTPDECAAATYPTSNGTSTLNIKNFGAELNAAAGDYLSFAVEIIKAQSGNRPQKLRVYQSDCQNMLGTQVSFSGQPKTEDGGMTVDLRNTNDPQLRTLLYQVPTGMNPIYLSFVVDENNDSFVYKKLKINVTGSGIVDSYTGITLGANNNAAASRLASATGQTFLACDAAENINYIDITYAVAITSPYNSYLASNPARFTTPLVGLSTSTVDCGEDGSKSTGGGRATHFAAASGIDYAAATDSEINNLAVTTADPQYIQVTGAGQVFAFLNSDGRKGLIRIASVNQLNNTSGSIVVDVKVQR